MEDLGASKSVVWIYKEGYERFSFSNVAKLERIGKYSIVQQEAACVIQTPILPYVYEDVPKQILEVVVRVDTAPPIWTPGSHGQFAKPIQRDIFHFLLACRQLPFSWFYADLRAYMCQKLVEIHGDAFKCKVCVEDSAGAFYNLLKRAEIEICQLAHEQHFANECVDPLLETAELVKIKETAADEVSNFVRLHTCLIYVPFASRPLLNLKLMDGNCLQSWIEFRVPVILKESQLPILTVSRHE